MMNYDNHFQIVFFNPGRHVVTNLGEVSVIQFS